MQCAEIGDKVRIDIPDKDDPDYRYHNEHGEIADVRRDDAGEPTEDDRDSYLYRVRLASGEQIDVRWRDLRPPIE